MLLSPRPEGQLLQAAISSDLSESEIEEIRLQLAHEFERRCNPELVDLEPLDHDDLAFVLGRIARHVELTGSALGARLLAEWSSTSLQFTKVMPRDYKRALATTMPAFEPVPVLNGRMVAHG